MSQPQLPRGRPRNFDRDELINKVLKVFWSEGYDRVSMDRLCEITKLSKPSFYNVFDSKEHLFLECVGRYHEIYVVPLLAELLVETDPALGFKKLMRAAATRFEDPKVPAGCLVLTGAVEAKGKSKAIDEELDRLQASLLDQIEAYFKTRLLKKSRFSARLVAQFVLAQLCALALYSRTNAKIFDFAAIIEVTQVAFEKLFKSS